MTYSVAFFIGTVLGSLAVVQLFKFIAGANFMTWRQAFAAYLAFAIAAIFIIAVGDANGGPPNFSSAPIRAVGTVVAFLIELVAVRGRRARQAELKPPPLRVEPGL
jgi:hypothetical protein